MHIIEQFNGGVYDTIIASDEKILELEDDKSSGKGGNASNKRFKFKSSNFNILMHFERYF